MKTLILSILAIALVLTGYLLGERYGHRNDPVPEIKKDTVYLRDMAREKAISEWWEKRLDSLAKQPKVVTAETIQKLKDRYEKANVSDTAFNGWILRSANRWSRYIDSVQSQTRANDTAGTVRKD